MIAGFILSILGMVAMLLGFVMPRYYDVFIPVDRRDEGVQKTVLNEPTSRFDEQEPYVGHSSGDDGGESGSLRGDGKTPGTEKDISAGIESTAAKGL